MKKKHLRNRLIGFENNSGSIMLEFAIILPVLLLMFAGLVQFGFYLSGRIAVNSASYEGSRTAAISDNPEYDAMVSIQDYASSSLPGWSFDDRLTADIRFSGFEPGDTVSVDVIYDIPVFFPGVPGFSNEGKKLGSVCGSSMMRIEEKD